MTMEAPAWRIEQVPCSDLADLPVRVRDVDEQAARAAEAGARRAAAPPRPVIAAKVGPKPYVVNDFEAAAGLRRAGAPTVQACVYDRRTVGEAVMDHVRACLFPYVASPLRIHGVAEYLVDHGTSRAEIDEALRAGRHPELVRVLDCDITPGARGILQDMADQISQRRYPTAVESHYVTKLSKIREDAQAEAAGEIARVTLAGLGYHSAFSWLSVTKIDIILKCYPRRARR